MATHGRAELIDARWIEVQPGNVLDTQAREKNDRYRVMLHTLLEDDELPEVVISGTLEPHKWRPGDVHIEGIIVATSKRILAVDGGKKQKDATIYYGEIKECTHQKERSQSRIDLAIPLGKDIKVSQIPNETTAQAFVNYIQVHLDPDAFNARIEAEQPQVPAKEDSAKSKVDQQWEAVKPSSWGSRMHSGERQMLYQLLGDGESIRSMIGGTYRAEQDTNRLHKHNGIAVATDKRVIFLDKGILGSTEVSEIPYRNIEAITYSTGILMAGVQISGRGVSGFRIEDITDKKSVKPFVDCVRIHFEAAYAQNVATVDRPVETASTADEIEKLASLLGRGILTQEEFDAKKKQLLGL